MLLGDPCTFTKAPLSFVFIACKAQAQGHSFTRTPQSKVKTSPPWTSLAVQWLGIHLPVLGMQVQSLVWELRSHMPWSTAKKKKAKTCPHLNVGACRHKCPSQGQWRGRHRLQCCLLPSKSPKTRPVVKDNS